MKQENTIFQDYHGMFYYIAKNKSKNLTIFLIDDDPFYLLLLKEELSKNSNFRVMTFPKREDCLSFLHLKPDLAIIDFHLNSKHSFAKNGAIIAKEIKAVNPETETFIISSDHKLAMMQELSNKNDLKIHFKNENIAVKIWSRYNKIKTIRNKKWMQQAIFPSILITSLILIIIIYLNL